MRKSLVLLLLLKVFIILYTIRVYPIFRSEFFSELMGRCQHAGSLCDASNRLCVGMLCDKVRRQMVCSQCVSSSVLSNLSFGWMLYRTPGTCVASHLIELKWTKEERKYLWKFICEICRCPTNNKDNRNSLGGCLLCENQMRIECAIIHWWALIVWQKNRENERMIFIWSI